LPKERMPQLKVRCCAKCGSEFEPDKVLRFGSSLKLNLASPARNRLLCKQRVVGSNPSRDAIRLTGIAALQGTVTQ
jgi:hypothetical protein